MLILIVPTNIKIHQGNGGVLAMACLPRPPVLRLLLHQQQMNVTTPLQIISHASIKNQLPVVLAGIRTSHTAVGCLSMKTLPV